MAGAEKKTRRGDEEKSGGGELKMKKTGGK